MGDSIMGANRWESVGLSAVHAPIAADDHPPAPGDLRNPFGVRGSAKAHLDRMFQLNVRAGEVEHFAQLLDHRRAKAFVEQDFRWHLCHRSLEEGDVVARQFHLLDIHSVELGNRLDASLCH